MANDQWLVLRHGLRRCRLREVRYHRFGAFAFVCRDQRHPPDSDPLCNIRPRHRERRRAFLDAKTRVRECLLVAVPGARIGFAPLRTTKDYLAIFAPSLRTKDRAQRLSNAVVALAGGD